MQSALIRLVGGCMKNVAQQSRASPPGQTAGPTLRGIAARAARPGVWRLVPARLHAVSDPGVARPLQPSALDPLSLAPARRPAIGAGLRVARSRPQLHHPRLLCLRLRCESDLRSTSRSFLHRPRTGTLAGSMQPHPEHETPSQSKSTEDSLTDTAESPPRPCQVARALPSRLAPREHAQSILNAAVPEKIPTPERTLCGILRPAARHLQSSPSDSPLPMPDPRPQCGPPKRFPTR